MIVSVVHIKGGVGKSTIAANLAFISSQNGNKTLLVDADQQKTVSSWVQHRQHSEIDAKWTTIQLNGTSVRTEILKMQPNYDAVIVDAGGRDTHSLRAALSVSDVSLIPCPPRSFDIWSMDQLYKIIEEARNFNPDLMAKAFINMGDSHGNDNRVATDILKEFEGIRFLPCVVGNRKAFINAAGEGKSVVELKPKQTKAVDEILSLYTHVFEPSLATV